MFSQDLLSATQGYVIASVVWNEAAGGYIVTLKPDYENRETGDLEGLILQARSPDHSIESCFYDSEYPVVCRAEHPLFSPRRNSMPQPLQKLPIATAFGIVSDHLENLGSTPITPKVQAEIAAKIVTAREKKSFPQRKLTDYDIGQINRDLVAGIPVSELARAYAVSPRTIRRVRQVKRPPMWEA